MTGAGGMVEAGDVEAGGVVDAGEMVGGPWRCGEGCLLLAANQLLCLHLKCVRLLRGWSCRNSCAEELGRVRLTLLRWIALKLLSGFLQNLASLSLKVWPGWPLLLSKQVPSQVGVSRRCEALDG